MAEATQLEKTAQTAPQQEKKEEKKPKGPSALDEIVGAAKNITATAIGAASPFVFNIPNTPIYNPNMGINAAVTAAPLQLGAMVDDIMAKKPVNYVRAGKEGIVGTLITLPIAKVFDGIEVARQYVTNAYGAIPGGAAAVAALAGTQAAFVGAYMGLNHIIQNYSFKGLYQKFKNEYWQSIKNTWKYVLPLSSLNVLLIPLTPLYQAFGVAAQLAYSSLMTFLFRLVIKAKDAKFSNLFKAMNPVPYAKAVATAPTKLLSGLYKIVQDTGYAFGSIQYQTAPAPAK